MNQRQQLNNRFLTFDSFIKMCMSAHSFPKEDSGVTGKQDQIIKISSKMLNLSDRNHKKSNKKKHITWLGIFTSLTTKKTHKRILVYTQLLRDG